MLILGIALAGSAKVSGGERTFDWESGVSMRPDGGVCSGTVVSSRVVTTAAHCVFEHDVDEVVFGPATLEGTTVGIEEVFIHAEYSGEYEGSEYRDDVALIVLSEAVDIVAPPLATEDQGWNEVVIVGYGRPDIGHRQVGRGTIDLVSDEYIRLNGDQSVSCEGDSGGGWYAWDAERELYVQWGLTSSGVSGCTSLSFGPRLDANPWIWDVLDEVHGTTDACTITNRLGDGVCDDWCATEDPDCIEPEPKPVEQPQGCSTVVKRWNGLLGVLSVLVAAAVRR
jgi:hypothetical protein